MKKTLSENIRETRQRFGYRTQAQFAIALGVPQPQVSDWENGRYHDLSLHTLLRIAKALDCSVDVLLFGVDAEYDEIILKDLRGIPEAVEEACAPESHPRDTELWH